MTTKIEVVYNANYNGCTVVVNGIEHEERGEEIVDLMYDSCDDEGYCGCSVDYIVRTITAHFHAKYGSDDVVVDVKIDTTST